MLDDMTSSIGPGDHLFARDAWGKPVRLRALSGVETKGHNFPVVWVERPLAAGGTDRVPWPVEAIKMTVKEA